MLSESMACLKKSRRSSCSTTTSLRTLSVNAGRFVVRDMDATLGILQEFVANGQDGWERALDTMDNDAERFLDSLRRLGEVTGRMHAALGSDSEDPAFCPEEMSVESLGPSAAVP